MIGCHRQDYVGKSSPVDKWMCEILMAGASAGMGCFHSENRPSGTPFRLHARPKAG